MLYHLDYKTDKLKAVIELPMSKSISNRLLIIKSLSGERLDCVGLSDSDDTRVLIDGLQSDADIVDVGHAGTSMRFLTAYFAAVGSRKTITGSERMKERPIRDLVEALNGLGASISYLGREGCPPVRTSGLPLTGNSVSISGNTSSQFISALLLIAPTLPEGLTIHIEGEPVSASYIEMTLALMQKAGVTAHRQGQTIAIARQSYNASDIQCERDWSAASYWYSAAAIAAEADITIPGLTDHSLQGDAVCAELFAPLGVETRFTSEGAHLLKTKTTATQFEYDFINAPDIVQTLAVCLCLKGIPFRLTGVHTLKMKETDRLAALQAELLKLGFAISATTCAIEWDGRRQARQPEVSIATYRDHRMAMAFAPAAIAESGISIENPEVVTKSYPTFWDAFNSIPPRYGL